MCDIPCTSSGAFHSFTYIIIRVFNKLYKTINEICNIELSYVITILYTRIPKVPSGTDRNIFIMALWFQL